MQRWLSGYASWYAKRMRMLTLASGEDEGVNRGRRRRMVPVTVDAILDATAMQYGTSADRYCDYRSGARGRDVAVMLCRRSATATLRELSGRFGLSHPNSASDLITRAKRFATSRFAPRKCDRRGSLRDPYAHTDRR